jgi:ATP-dependent DNA helicase RecG
MTKISSTGVENIINRLKNKGILVRRGTKRRGYWDVITYEKIDGTTLSVQEKMPTITNDKLGNKLGGKLGNNERKIMQLINDNNRISTTTIAQAIPLSSTSVETIIKRLKEKGILRRIGSAKSGYWEISIK